MNNIQVQVQDEERLNISDNLKDQYEKPIHILEYDPVRVFLKAYLVISIIVYFFYLLLIGTPRKFPLGFLGVIICDAFCLLFLLKGLLAFVELNLTNRIELYGDRIEKVWRLFGRQSIKLNEAFFSGENWPFMNMKMFSDHKPNIIETLFLVHVIHYDERVAYPQDVRIMNELLAKLSNREISEITKSYFIEKFKKGV